MGVFKKQGNWWIDFYHQGKRIRRKVGPSKRLAEMALADVQVKKAKNEFLGVCQPKKILFKDFVDEYVKESKAEKARSSYERDGTTINTHLLPFWGEERIDRITPKMIKDYRDERIKHVKPATVNRELFTIRSIFRKAVENGYLKESPAAPVKKLETGTPLFRYLDDEEIKSLLAACRMSDNTQLYPFVFVAISTGMRLGEITALEWKDIDFKRGIIRVDNKKDHHTKNYEPRTVPMNAALTEVLRKIPRRLDCSYVFHRQDGEKFNKMRTGFGNAVRRAGIPHLTVHDLRHTCASHLVMGGVDIRTVQEILGHKDIRMTMRYAHLAPGHMRNAVKVLDAIMGENQGVQLFILDGHYLDTRGSERENQGAADQA
ncbi:MAG: tyrosine-type recombinase/integrase [Thermodesulfobacteriota bacterium]